MNLEKFDINLIIGKLKEQRKIFVSEADLQFAIAFIIKEQYPNAKIRLEYCPEFELDMHIDILVIIGKDRYPIELKYKTKKYETVIDNEKFVLKEHGAIPVNSYLYLKDIKRLEECRKMMPEFKTGYAIFITNDLGYLKSPVKNDLIYKQLALIDNSKKTGKLNWEDNASDGTKKNVEEEIELKDIYLLKWNNYSNFGNKNGMFMYLMNEVK